MPSLPDLIDEISRCHICKGLLPHEPQPVLQAGSTARILIAGQAPGRKVHESGIPFNDASGNRLREWLGVSRKVFYDPACFAILPMGFCFPGTGRSGDLPPRAECAPVWRQRVLDELKHVQLTLVIGQYAMAWHLPSAGPTLTDVVRNWRSHWPKVLPLPHPSPRNQLWLKRNPWFNAEVLPVLRARVAEVLG